MMEITLAEHASKNVTAVRTGEGMELKRAAGERSAIDGLSRRGSFSAVQTTYTSRWQHSVMTCPTSQGYFALAHWRL